MPIWSLTLERLEKLRQQIGNKKAEHDELLALTEKDLWCRDLDEFIEEWDKQMKLDADIQTNIRRMGRRASKKIGAGRSRKAKDDDEYEPEKKPRAKKAAAPKAAAAKAAAPVKTETKSAQRFADMFSSAASKDPKPKKEPNDDDFSDDDFAALSRGKSAEQTLPSRNKRAAASKAKTLFEIDTDSDEDVKEQVMDDIDDLVKGIDKPPSAEKPSADRLSLHAMSRPGGSPSSANRAKAKKASKPSMDLDSPDETNYELLAKSSPQRVPSARGDDLTFSSEEEPRPAAASKAKGKAAAPAAAAKKAAPAARAKAAPAAKKTALSPAAKAYATKKAAGKKSAADFAMSDDDDDDELGEPAEADSPPPKPAARTRPGRAAAARKPVVIDEDSLMDEDDDEESEDPFEMDDDDD